MQQKTTLSYANWNIFARELEEILHLRGMNLDHLADCVCIHPERVLRLKRSLHMPRSLPALSSQEIDTLVAELALDEQEVLRLQAALLTNAIQRTLTLFIEVNDARQATEALFLTILQSLRDLSARGDLGNTRGGDFESMEDRELDSELLPALDAIDSGIEALQMSQIMTSRTMRVKKALQAQAHFSEALESLKHMGMDIQWQEGWQYWYGEARQGLERTNQWLAKSGG